MLSERQLSRGYKDFWNSLTPNLNDHFLSSISSVNGVNHHYLEQWAQPIEQLNINHKSNDLIAEIGFNLFEINTSHKATSDSIDTSLNLSIATSKAILEISKLRKSEYDQSAYLTIEHIKIAQEISKRLENHLKPQNGVIIIHPEIPGSGILNSCQPDIVQGNNLIEIKASKDFFRCSDIKQALIYACLNWKSDIYPIKSISLINPRLGITLKFPIEELISKLSCCSSPIFFRNFIKKLTY